MSKKFEIVIIGAGYVGVTIAHTMLLNQIFANVILYDVDTKKARGQYMDLTDTVVNSNLTKIKYSEDLDINNADIVIICCGARQKPRQSRLELFSANQIIFREIFQKIPVINPKTKFLVVTNPVDLMTHYLTTLLKHDKSKVMGTGTLLETIRFKNLIEDKLAIDPRAINLFVIGEHGDQQIPVFSSANVANFPLKKLIPESELKDFEKQVKNRAYEIIACKEGTCYSIAYSVFLICKAIMDDTKTIFPTSHYQENYNICFSMPSVISQNGIAAKWPIELDINEGDRLDKSVENLKKFII